MRFASAAWRSAVTTRSSGVAGGRSSRRQRPSLTSRALARKPGAGVVPAALAQSAPCTAIACAAYSIAALASRPLVVRSGWCGSRWLTARHSMRVASHAVTRSSRHIGPRCGIRAAMPAWSSVAGGMAIDSRPGRARHRADEEDVRERRAAMHGLAGDREAEFGEPLGPGRQRAAEVAAEALAAREADDAIDPAA